jgi:hypothetical protein
MSRKTGQTPRRRERDRRHVQALDRAPNSGMISDRAFADEAVVAAWQL